MSTLDLIGAFKEKIANGCVYGPFMKTGDPAFVEASGYAGFDFAILDMEHGPVCLENMQNNVRAAQVAGLLPIIRVRDKMPESISQALDIGAAGVQVPQVCTASQAREVIAAAKYHPQGERGVCRFVRAANYSATERSLYFRQANEALVILQLEGQEAIRNLDEILDVEGYDILFVGPYDLSQSLGHPGEVTHPEVVAKIRDIVDAASRKGKVVGTFVDTPESVAMWKDAGIRYLSYSVDLGIYLDACRKIVKMCYEV